MVSTLDLASGYYQVEIHPDDAPKTAFVTTSRPFLLSLLKFRSLQRAATFERLMDFVMAGLKWETCLIYLDDIICFSTDFESHLLRLDEILTRLEKANLKVSPKKCSLFKHQVHFLGHVVSDQGVSTDPEKIKAVTE